MLMSEQRLPLEITETTFRLIDRNELKKLLYVCKEWHPVVKSIYYEKVTWSAKRIQWLKQQLEANKVNSNKTQTFKQLPMTKRLKIVNDVDYKRDVTADLYSCPSTRFTKKEFLYLLTRFPNLKYLDILRSIHRKHYLKTLCACPKNEQLPPVEEIVMGKNFAEDHDEKSRLLKFATCHRFQDSLKRMSIIYTNIPNNGRKSFMEHITDFKSLSTLELYNDTDSNITLFHLFEVCPSLSTLVYTSTFPIPHNAAQQLEDMTRKSKDQNLSISQLLKKLKKLKLSLPSLTAPYIDFFTEHKPENLDDVDIRLTKIGMYTWMNEVKMDVALIFFKSLQKLTFIQLTFDLEHVMDHKEIDTFYQVLNALAGDREFRSRTVIQKDTDDVDTKGNQICISDSELNYTYYFDVESNCYNVTDTTEDSAPSASTIKQLAEVNNFEIRTAHEDEEFNRVPNYYFEYANKYFPKLTRFQILCGIALRSMDATCPSGSQSLQNMTSLCLDGFENPELALKNILRYLPRIEKLTFGLHGFSMLFNSQRAAFNLTNFTCLRSLIVVAECENYFKTRTLFLEYTNSSNNQCAHYQLKTPNRRLVNENFFEVISAEAMEEQIESGEAKNVYVVNIQGTHQLEKFELKHYGKAYAGLTL